MTGLKQPLPGYQIVFSSQRTIVNGINVLNSSHFVSSKGRFQAERIQKSRNDILPL
jgi:hypothetical protein